MSPAELTALAALMQQLPALVNLIRQLVEAVTQGHPVEIKVLRPQPFDPDAVLDQAERELGLGASPLAQTEPPPPDTARTPAPSLPAWPEEATTAVQVPHPQGES